MEIIIALAVLVGVLYWFFIRKSEVEVATYKVETTPVVEPTPAPVVEAVVEPTPAPVVEAPVPVVEAVVEAPAKAPRKPRAPKTEATPAKTAAKKSPSKSQGSY